MSNRRVAVPVVIALAFAVLFFGLGSLAARPGVDAQQIAALRAEIDQLRKFQPAAVTGTSGITGSDADRAVEDEASRAAIVEDVKRQLQSEMGLLPLTLIRDRRQSFVELYSYDDRGASSYGTAGYLGNGYFITVKHGVIALGQEGAADPREIVSIKLMHEGRALSAKVVDAGDARVEVDPGDWAILKVKEPIDLPALNVNLDYQLRFRRPDLPARQRLLEGDHRRDRLRRPAHAEQAGDVPHRRASGRVRRRRAQHRRSARRHPDRPDAG